MRPSPLILRRTAGGLGILLVVGLALLTAAHLDELRTDLSSAGDVHAGASADVVPQADDVPAAALRQLVAAATLVGALAAALTAAVTPLRWHVAERSLGLPAPAPPLAAQRRAPPS